MRTGWIAAALLIASCGPSSRELQLERRVGDLENQQRSQAGPDARAETMQKRIDELESLVRELRTIEVQMQTSVAQLAADREEHPMPSGHAGLDENRAYPVPTDDSPQLGPANDSAVTLVAAVQFPEPYTHKSWPILQQLRKEYGKKLRVVVKTFVVHKQAHDSTIVGCAVAKQGKLDAFEPALWDAKDKSNQWPDATAAKQIAFKLGVDKKRLERDIAGPCAVAIERDQKMFEALGQDAVPVFWIDGRPLSGAQPIDVFRTIIDAERAKIHSAKDVF
jgi:protein-disulfide isomerase